MLGHYGVAYFGFAILQHFHLVLLVGRKHLSSHILRKYANLYSIYYE